MSSLTKEWFKVLNSGKWTNVEFNWNGEILHSKIWLEGGYINKDERYLLVPFENTKEYCVFGTDLKIV